MLTPDYLYNVSDRAIELYEELNTWAVNDICRRLVNADWQFTGSIDWQLYKLQQSGMHMDEIVKKVAQLTKKSQTEIAEIFEEATYKSQSYDNEVYKKAGLLPIDIKQSPQMLKILQATYEQTMGELKNFTRTTANASQSIFLKTMDDVYFRVISGQQSYSEAIRQAINGLANTGIVVSYPSGHKDTIETAVRRCVMTGVGQATARASIQNAKEMETDLVLVSAHLGARPSHAEWQGKVYSISGNSKKYAKLSEATGYGTVTGLCGANCRHHFMPYIEGVSTNPYEEFDSEKNEEYYNNQQIQRKKERNIRTTKRQLQALEISIDATRDDKLKFALQQDYDRKAAKLKVQMVDYKEFSKKAELPMQNERLQIAKWNKKQEITVKNIHKNAKMDLEDHGRIMDKAKRKYDDTTRTKPAVALENLKGDKAALLWAVIEHAPEPFKEIIKKNSKNIKFAKIDAIGGSRATKNGIFTNIDKDMQNKKGAWTSTFHEIGHVVDRLYKRVSYNEEFGKALRNDFDAFTKMYMSSYNISMDETYNELSKYLKNAVKQEAHVLSDLFGGMTDNKCVGSAFHTKSYWKNPYALEREAFAHFFSASVLEYEDKLNAIKSAFPNAYDEFMKIVGGL